MPVKVHDILSPQAPAPPSPPQEEAEILEFLGARSDEAFSFSEILMGVHAALVTSQNGFLSALAGVFLVSLAESANNKYTTALESLVKKNLVKTRTYDKKQYYWAATQPQE